MRLFSGPLFSAAVGGWLCVATSACAAVDTVTSAADSGPGSLRDTIAAAAPGDTIVFSSALAGQTIYLISGELFIAQNMTIDASALTGGVAIDGGGSDRVLEIANTNISIVGLTVTNGYGDWAGGVLLDDTNCSLTASNCVFCGNSAEEYGGAISGYGTVTLDNCIVAGNSANIGGGGIFGYEGVLTLNNCVLSGNSAPVGGGGAIGSELGTLTLNGSIISNNFAAVFGGGVDGQNDNSFALTNCVFVGNTNSSGTGGGLSAETPATLSDCIFSNNVSNGTGGGGVVSFEAMTLCNCIFSGNSTTNYGLGGALVNSGTLTMNNCIFSGNSAVDGNGGGLGNAGWVIANNCTWSGNTASNGYGGGIYNNGVITLNNCTLSDNSATNGYGGALSSLGSGAQDATNILINCTICSNSADGGTAGGIYDEASGILMLTNTIVAANVDVSGSNVFGVYSGFANFIGGNPQLASLGSYGGTTPTMPPEFGSPVIDAGTDWVTNILVNDQRGYPRLAGAHVDIGAVEAQAAPANNSPVLQNPSYQSNVFFSGGDEFFSSTFTFSFTNAANADFTVLASTNLALPLAQWTELGNASQPLVPGQFEYSDEIQAAVDMVFPPQKFYRVVSP